MRENSVSASESNLSAHQQARAIDPVVYQHFYLPEQRSSLDPAFLPSNGIANPFPNLYEMYWIMRIFETDVYKNHAYTGMVSYHFTEKTGIRGSEFLGFIADNPGFDVYFINPFPQYAYLYFNVWHQAEIHHPGLVNRAQALLHRLGYAVNLARMARNTDATLCYCNFWVGAQEFWEQYMAFVRPLYYLAIEQYDQRDGAFAPTTYKDREYPFFPFVFERLFSTFLLLNPHIRACPYVYTRTQILRHCKNVREATLVAAVKPLIDYLDGSSSSAKDAVLKTLFRSISKTFRNSPPREQSPPI